MKNVLTYLIMILLVLPIYQNIDVASRDVQMPKPSYLLHYPIYIIGDDDFTPENGVVAGNGTKENPYIIEGCEIRCNLFLKALNSVLWKLERYTNLRNYVLNIALCGIYIRDTTKHVVIRNNYIHGWYGRREDFPMSGIIIINATNITIEDNTFEDNFYGIFIPNYIWDGHWYRFYNSSNIIVKSNKIKGGNVGIRISYTYNCSIIYNEISNCETGGISSCSGTIYIAENYIYRNGNGIFAGHKNIIENNTIVNNGNGIYCFSSGPEDFNGSDLLITNNTIVGNLAGIFVSPGHPTILNNTITNGIYGILRMSVSKEYMVVMDNIIANNSCGINSMWVGPAIIKHNLISSNGAGIEYGGKAFIEYNVVVNNAHGISVSASGEDEYPSLHYNNIVGNKGGVRYVETIWDVLINATYNYWGSPDGPSGYGSGHGDSVDRNIIFEPWLSEPVENAGRGDEGNKYNVLREKEQG